MNTQVKVIKTKVGLLNLARLQTVQLFVSRRHSLFIDCFFKERQFWCKAIGV
jgi:hypothetical protein